jgi:DNA-binding CsgD family transcriptional regulator
LLLYFYLTIRNKYKRISLEKMELKLESQNKELEKELLKAKIQEKNKELTAKLLYETKRIRIIKNTVDKLIGHKNEFSKQGRVIVGNVVRELSQFDQDKVFNEFESAFLDLHIDFYKNLMEAYPDLTQNERRLCALIRLNLNSREISALTGQTATTLNMAKTRLRKKLGITHSELDLYEVLCRF